jgi:hypothetical protein
MRRLTPLLALLAALSFGQANDQVTQKALKVLAGLEKTYVAAKAKSVKAPKDAKLKTSYIKATMALADEEMTSLGLPARVKYKKALAHYREVKKVDPKNAKAKQNIDLIEGIYKQMGRPIPPS